MLLDIIIPALLIGLLGLLFGAMIAFTGKLFAVKENPLKESVRALLPGASALPKYPFPRVLLREREELLPL